jgi:hypothetical protein
MPLMGEVEVTKGSLDIRENVRDTVTSWSPNEYVGSVPRYGWHARAVNRHAQEVLARPQGNVYVTLPPV